MAKSPAGSDGHRRARGDGGGRKDPAAETARVAVEEVAAGREPGGATVEGPATAPAADPAEVQVPESPVGAVDPTQAAKEAGGEDAGWTAVYGGHAPAVAAADDPEAQAPEAPAPTAALDPAWPREIQLYYWMRLSRGFEDRCGKLYRQGEIKGGLYSGIGQEATTVGIGAPLEEGDFVAPLHRDIGLFLMRGADPRRLMAQIMGRETGYSRGHDSWSHAGDLERGILGSVSHLGATLPVLAGAALAFRQRGLDRVAVGTFGEGTSSRGDFHEAANFVGVHKLACVFVCVNNQYAYSTPPELSYPIDHVVERAAGYGMFGDLVDGNDLGDVLAAMERAVRRARAGEGPSLLECVTFRLRGHSEHDPADYVDKDELLRWKAKDPIERWERYLELKGHDLAQVRSAMDPIVEAILKDAVAFAKRSPFAPGEVALEDLLAEPLGEADPGSVWMRGNRPPEGERPVG